MPQKEWIRFSGMSINLLAPDGSVGRTFAAPASDATFYEPIGQVISNWSLWETYVNDLISALRKASGQRGKQWYGMPYSKRVEILTDEWGRFARGHRKLVEHVESAVRASRSAKTLRDHLAHDILQTGIDFLPSGDEKWMRFRRHKNLRQFSRKYTLADLHQAASELSSCAGELHLIRDGFADAQFSPAEVELLHSLPRSELLNRLT